MRLFEVFLHENGDELDDIAAPIYVGASIYF
jgi:hypothetical protein